jgi:nitrate reductase assembly molybdenum cofactor insertion protein NarJ
MESFLSNDKITGHAAETPPNEGTAQLYSTTVIIRELPPFVKRTLGQFRHIFAIFCEVLSQISTSGRKKEPILRWVPQNSYVLIFD